MKRQINLRRLLAACAVLGTAALLAACGGSSSSKSSGSTASASNAAQTTSGNSSAVLTVESSQQNAITQNFNPYVQSSAASLLGATSLIYEPLLQANAIKPGQYYNWLATGYTWSNGGKSITFTIRPGVKWSNGTPMTAADVAFTFNMLKKYPDVNNTGLAVGSVSSSGQPGNAQLRLAPVRQPAEHRRPDVHRSRSRSGARWAIPASTPTRTPWAAARTRSRSSARRA